MDLPFDYPKKALAVVAEEEPDEDKDEELNQTKRSYAPSLLKRSKIIF